MVTFKALGLTALCFLTMGALASGYEESIKREITRVDDHVVSMQYENSDDVENKEDLEAPKQNPESEKPKVKARKRNGKTRPGFGTIRCLRRFANKCTR